MNRIDQIVALVKEKPSPGLVLALLIAVAALAGGIVKMYFGQEKREKEIRLEVRAEKDSLYATETKYLKEDNSKLRYELFHCKDEIVIRTDAVVKQMREDNRVINEKFESNSQEREKLIQESRKLAKQIKNNTETGNKLLDDNLNGNSN